MVYRKLLLRKSLEMSDAVYNDDYLEQYIDPDSVSSEDVAFIAEYVDDIPLRTLARILGLTVKYVRYIMDSFLITTSFVWEKSYDRYLDIHASVASPEEIAETLGVSARYVMYRAYERGVIPCA